jgi:ribosomal protein L34
MKSKLQPLQQKQNLKKKNSTKGYRQRKTPKPLKQKKNSTKGYRQRKTPKPLKQRS